MASKLECNKVRENSVTSMQLQKINNQQ